MALSKIKKNVIVLFILENLSKLKSVLHALRNSKVISKTALPKENFDDGTIMVSG